MRIAIITGSRAEWGLLQPLAKLMHEDKGIDFKLLVTGSHLSYEFGYTKNDIDLPIEEEIECVLSSDTAVGISKALGLAVISFSEAYKRIAPDLVVVLGDRWEILACSIAAHIARIPIAHIHGGEVTEGAYDDAFRHSITHMSQLHFVAADAYKMRVIQLGNSPETVFNVGALGCDGSIKRKWRQLEPKQILLAYYPETLNDGTNIEHLLSVIAEKEFKTVVFIKGCYDIGQLGFHYLLDDYDINTYERHDSINRGLFLEKLKSSDAIIGNSSSGIIEAPALGVPTINIGNRQEGRLMADSIIQCNATKESIKQAFDKLYSKEFQDLMKSDYKIFYQGGNVAQKILEVIKQKMPISVKKEFYDLETS
jgi:GDP/UDP-N,N'-diacetylbacillosamine 2-epimerase (hydrolysing)